VVRRAVKIAIPVALVALVAAGVWLVFTGTRALAAVRDLRAAVDNVKIAVDDTDLPGLEQAARDAQDAATRADDALDDPLWAAVAAIPYVGDSAEVARVTAAALATAADGLTPLLDAADVLDPASLFANDRIDVDRLQAAQEPLAQAAAAVGQAAEQIATAPAAEDGAWVPASLDTQRAEAADQLDEAAETLTTASAAAEVMPALLGAEGPRTWFVALQSPSEARGTGGLVGNHVILTADDGRLSLVRVGGNADFETLSVMPDFGPDFDARYGQQPRLFANSNLSPHLPYAAQLWAQFDAESFGESVDVVVGSDVVALGYLVRATGPITLPDGRTIGPDDAVEFGLTGIYSAYPDDDERNAFQELAAESIFAAVTTGDAAGPELVDAVAAMIRDNRLTLWSPDPTEQQALLELPTSGSIAGSPGPYAHPVIINGSGSKLDAFLDRSIRYGVGRCPVDGQVRSNVEVTLTSDLPESGLTDYQIGQAERGPDGPISRTQLQVHLSEGAFVNGVTVDGERVAHVSFQEQGRPAALVQVDLPPRRPVTIALDVSEPDSGLPAVVGVQPLARPPTVEVVDVECGAPSPSPG
jgi:hypothetical protein